ncbi:hypothetical protein AB5J62_24710 [Amycolatopsis sp. cg5]|uniref:NmrA family NAD(P)-binding protein n=1 Tax=Amycolatopsis sp. cg5 TaxID=3238802 RepID=UPI0035255FB1
MSVLVTGASGTVGGATARLLEGRVPIVSAGRRVQALPSSMPGVRLDYDDPSTFPAALRGVSTIYLICPPADPDAGSRLLPFIDAAADAGVEHIVVNSAPIAGLDKDFSLSLVERAVEQSGCHWTHLRSQWYASSLTTGVFAPLTASGDLALPLGSGRIAFVDPGNVAAVAAAVLREPGEHRGRVHDITGPEALDGPRLAQVLSDHGSPVRYRDVSDEEFLAWCRAVLGVPSGVAEFVLVLLAAARAGHTASTTGTIKALTGRPATSLGEFLAAR